MSQITHFTAQVARMGSPLMFSFMEREGVNQSITMRIGNGLHTGTLCVNVHSNGFQTCALSPFLTFRREGYVVPPLLHPVGGQRAPPPRLPSRRPPTGVGIHSGRGGQGREREVQEHSHRHAGAQVPQEQNHPSIYTLLYSHVFIYQLFFRFQLYNQSSHRMVFSQSCYAATVADPAAEATHLVALPQSSLAFHWPRLDRDQVNCPSFSFETYSI